MKTPKIFSKFKLSAVLAPRPKKQLRATARAARPAMEDYDEEEPTTKLSSAFIVVLILHVVAVGGIYAFNSIKASRRGHEPIVETAPAQPAPKVAKASMTDSELAASDFVPAAPRRTEPAVSAKPLATGRQYELKQGDTLSRIALAFGVTPAELMQANQLKEGAPLRPGHILVIPTKTAAKAPVIIETKKPEAPAKTADVPATKTTPGMYTVKKGDTATSIAKGLGVSIEELLKTNKIADPKKLQPGQTLKVPRKS